MLIYTIYSSFTNFDFCNEQVIEAVSLFISTHCKAYDWHINPSIVKLAKNKGTIYIDNTTAWAKSNHTSLNMNHAPEILAGGRFIPEKAFVWALGNYPL